MPPQNVYLAPGSVTVLRSSDWRALVLGANVSVSPSAKLSILPDEATVQDILATIAAWTPPPLPSPTG